MLLAGAAAAACAQAGTLTEPQVDAYNMRVGTQQFGPRYQFTSENVLIESAKVMLGMGSDTVKFAMGWGSRGQYGLVFDGTITSLAAQAERQPETRAVLDMPFRHIFVWAHEMTPSGGMTHWTGGVTQQNAQLNYREMYDLAAWLLRTYDGTGKHFYLGNWEGDWLLLENYNASVNPSPTRVQGMTDWLTIRQQAVDDARAAVPHGNVFVYHYVEVNRVRDAMVNGPSNNQRVVNAVLPHVPAMDFVSYSCYDAQNLSEAQLHQTLDYIEGNLGAAKDALVPGRRVFIGEYGWGRSLGSAAQEAPTRDFIRKVLNWGVPHILFWQLYNNEPGYTFWLIDDTGWETPCHDLHTRFINRGRLEAARFLEAHGRLPDPAEFAALMGPHLAGPLPPPEPFEITQSHRPSAAPGTVTVEAAVAAGIYGIDTPVVELHWGAEDGGTDPAAWEHRLQLGTLDTFRPARFAADIPAPSGAAVHYRFRATNGVDASWSAAAGGIRDTRLDTAGFRFRMRVTVPGFQGQETVAGLAVPLELHTGIPGFAYGQLCLPGGGDLRATAADGVTALPLAVSAWDQSGVSKIWIRLPAAGGPGDGFWLYWGNPEPPPAQSAQSFWAEENSLVLDFDDPAAPYADRSGQTVPAVSSLAPQLEAGVSGKAARISGSLTHLRLDAFDPGPRFTLQAWVRPDPGISNIQTVWANKSQGYNSNGVAWFFNDYLTASGSLILESGNGTTGAKLIGTEGAVSAGAWHLLTTVVDIAAGSAVHYVDGVRQAASGSFNASFARAGTWYLGRFADGAFALRGLVDEVRIDRSARSAAWIANVHAAHRDPASYLAFDPVTETPPRLDIACAGGLIHLQWPGHYTNWRLESAAGPSAGADWAAVDAPPEARDGALRLSLPAPGPAGRRFFRLARSE